MICFLQRAALLILFSGSVLAASYTLQDSHVGSGFLNAFSFQAIPDPTHGRV